MGDCKVYVGGLPNDATSEEIEDAFRRFGRIRKTVSAVSNVESPFLLASTPKRARGRSLAPVPHSHSILIRPASPHSHIPRPSFLLNTLPPLALPSVLRDTRRTRFLSGSLVGRPDSPSSSSMTAETPRTRSVPWTAPESAECARASSCRTTEEEEEEAAVADTEVEEEVDMEEDAA
ncbi:hypothetical protein PENTCL1PPCAC_8273 [Pristionchus entomophagus]|uniref:RRM domain-containing protein n=1 Tax=Pristionchus entomophagus TaxID=358040 RepID=A0AAV5SZS2_9BILA|nr:hypothetical protein PENTCL1PPCAC_8273 [Pristionchus entomophagus]